MEVINFPHSDAIIFKVNIREMEVRRLLIDNGSSCNILYLDGFLKMGIKSRCLTPCVGDFVSFTGYEAPITGMTTLPLTLGEWPNMTTEMVDFLVMDLLSTYNDIIGNVS